MANERPHLIHKGTWAVAGMLVLFAFVFSVGRSYGEAYDAIAIWANQGYGIALEGSIFAGEEWGMWGLSYPLNLMLQVATFMFFGQEALPGSKLMYPIYLVSLCLACYAFWLRSGVRRATAALGVLLVISNPAVYLHSTNGLSNFPFAAIYTLGILALVNGLDRDSVGHQLIGGTCLGLAAWTRPEGIGYAVATLLLLFGVDRVARRGRLSLVHSAVPVILLAGSWFVFGWRNVLDVQMPLGAAINSVLPNVARGNLNLFELYRIPRLFLERALKPDNWGAFVPAVAALLLIGWRLNRSWNQARNLYLGAVALLASAIPVGIYYVVSFEPFDDYIDILRRDFDRAYLPAFILLTLLAVNLWGENANTGNLQRDQSLLPN